MSHVGMLEGQRVTVVLPAYNAGQASARTVAEIPRGIVDDIIRADDASRDMYTPRLVTAMASMIVSGHYDCSTTCLLQPRMS